ncbi:MAG: hypothetical protein JWM64_228 [Frankiales bacterium]|nr:hypothetical protein [Frankiales bacterium]
MTRVVDIAESQAHTRAMESRQEREQRVRQEKLARMSEAIASIERTRKIVAERLARGDSRRAS